MRRWFWRLSYRWRNLRKRSHEAELRLLPALVERHELALDVGANRALYTHALRTLAKQVIAFEPVPKLAERLRLAYPDVLVHQLALSDRAGTAELRLPGSNTSWATLEPSNTLEKARAAIVVLEVRTERLDALPLEAPVGLLKIDVEGHELAVLEGARRLLERDAPNLLVELEERHTRGALSRASALLEPLGYQGYFLDGGVLRPLASFDLARDQDPAHVSERGKEGRYLNNFLFVHHRRPEVHGRLIERGVHLAARG